MLDDDGRAMSLCTALCGGAQTSFGMCWRNGRYKRGVVSPAQKNDKKTERKRRQEHLTPQCNSQAGPNHHSNPTALHTRKTSSHRLVPTCHLPASSPLDTQCEKPSKVHFLFPPTTEEPASSYPSIDRNASVNARAGFCTCCRRHGFRGGIKGFGGRVVWRKPVQCLKKVKTERPVCKNSALNPQLCSAMGHPRWPTEHKTLPRRPPQCADPHTFPRPG